MSIKYECYYCKSVFPVEESIDGYKQGFKVGFLCPKCGKNIQAGLLAKQKTTPEQNKWAVISLLLFLPVIFTHNSDTTYLIQNIEISISTLMFSLWMLFMILLLIIKPSLFKATTFNTEPVNNA